MNQRAAGDSDQPSPSEQAQFARLSAAAVELLTRQDYRSALEMVQQIPEAIRSLETKQLILRIERMQQEADRLNAVMQAAIAKQDYGKLLPVLQRLLQFESGNLQARELMEKLVTYSPGQPFRLDAAGQLLPARPPSLVRQFLQQAIEFMRRRNAQPARVRRAPSPGVLLPMPQGPYPEPEEPYVRQWLAWSFAVFLIASGLMYWANIRYIKRAAAVAATPINVPQTSDAPIRINDSIALGNTVNNPSGTNESEINSNSKNPRFAIETGLNREVAVDSLRYDGHHPLTLEAWLNIAPDAKGWLAPISWHSERVDANGTRLKNGAFFFCGISENSRRWYVFVNESYHPAEVVAETSRWLHAAMTIDNDTVRFFIDGRLVHNQSLSQPMRASEMPLLIGASYVVPTSPPPGSERQYQTYHDFSGQLDEIRVSKVVRYTSDFTPQYRFEPDSDTLALFHCDEGSGERLIDSSGNNHHGSIRNIIWVAEPTFPPTASASPAQSPKVDGDAPIVPSAVPAPQATKSSTPPASPSRPKYVVIPTAAENGHRWHFSMAPPPKGWQVPKGDDIWRTAQAAFGTPERYGKTVRTRWINSDIYLRTRVYVPKLDRRHIILRCIHDDGTEIYVNGKLLREFKGYNNYTDYKLSTTETALFRENALNDVAVHCHQDNASRRIGDTANPQVIDIGLWIE